MFIIFRKSGSPNPKFCLGQIKKISMFRVKGLKILGLVGIFFSFFFFEEKIDKFHAFLKAFRLSTCIK